MNWKSAGFGGVLLHASECALLEHFDAGALASRRGVVFVPLKVQMLDCGEHTLPHRAIDQPQRIKVCQLVQQYLPMREAMQNYMLQISIVMKWLSHVTETLQRKVFRVLWIARGQTELLLSFVTSNPRKSLNITSFHVTHCHLGRSTGGRKSPWQNAPHHPVASVPLHCNRVATSTWLWQCKRELFKAMHQTGTKITPCPPVTTG